MRESSRLRGLHSEDLISLQLHSPSTIIWGDGISVLRFLGNANITNCGVNGGELGGGLVSVRLTVEREEKNGDVTPTHIVCYP